MIVKELEIKYKNSHRCELQAVNSPEEVFNFFKDKIENKAEESFYVIILNSKNKIHGFIEASKGTVSEAIIHPREVFRAAILCNASAIIIAHNHPTGDKSPSFENKKTTERLCNSGKILGITVLDHIILTDEGFSSMKNMGLL